MAGSSVPIHGVGTGQPTRPDFEGRAHENVLRPGQSLDIPRQTVDGARPERDDPTHTASGWDRQEQAFAAGAQFEQRAGRWNDFSGNRDPGQPGANFGSVRVDEPGFSPTQPSNPFGGTAKDWVHAAAMLEERFRAEGSKVGINADIKLPGDGPVHSGPTGTGRNNGRRQFTLVT